MNCFDGSGYVLGGNCNVTPPYGAQLLSAVQRVRQLGVLEVKWRFPTTCTREADTSLGKMIKRLGEEPVHREFGSYFHLS